MRYAERNVAAEFSFHSSKTYRDPFNEVTLDAVVIAPDGKVLKVPAFWAGGNEWRIRFASPTLGTHRFRTVCSDTQNADLHGREGVIEVVPYEGKNPLFHHGPLRVASGGRHLEHLDGTPFFWLADTWWMALCKRLDFAGFRLLTADRVQKGFSVIQTVAGLYCDLPPFDPRGANAAGFPWTSEFGTINPEYFDDADLRIEWLIRGGLTPCILGCWGFYLPWMGVEKMQKHWRYLIARYGAYPVVWCMAGESIMPYYLTKTREEDGKMQRAGWTEVTRYVREIDPFHRLVSVHPYEVASKEIDDVSLLDFDMLQPGHMDRAALPSGVKWMIESCAREPRTPVINAEVCYEGFGDACRPDVQRLMFWTTMLTGGAGHSYGANGMWQMNGRDEPFGPSPRGMSWGHTPWEDAYRFAGSAQLSLGKKLLERFEWWRFEPHHEWVEPRWSEKDYFLPYAAGIPGELRVIYTPLTGGPLCFKAFETGSVWQGLLWDPITGKEYDLGEITPDAQGDWAYTRPPIFQDWVFVFQRRA